IDLLRIETRKVEVKLRSLEVLQLQSQQFLVPVRPSSRPVDHEPEGLDLRRCPFVAQDDRDIHNAQPARGFEPQMAVDDFAVTADQARDFETKLTNTAAQAIHSRVVLARVAGVKDQLVNWPHLDFHGYFSWHHNIPVSG